MGSQGNGVVTIVVDSKEIGVDSEVIKVEIVVD